jgi:DtxR family Mn-dependent transcriptional regulator
LEDLQNQIELRPMTPTNATALDSSQVDPLIALLLGVALLALAVLLFWPGSGLLGKLRFALRSRERVLIEDALKHLHDFEYRRQPATLESLAGGLGLSGNRAAQLLDRLERLDLVEREGENLTLTGEGRANALRVIRIHRLWESYLADETGLGPADWHRTAEVLEHTTSIEAADRLAVDLGQPRFDPHGDPIPTADGEILPRAGRPLTELEPDLLAEVVHVEDEPEAVYAQLVAEGLHPGVRVRVMERSRERIRFEADAREVILAPVLATNISVIALEDDEQMRGPFDSLSTVSPGQCGRIVGFAPTCRGAERRRLLDLGIIPGTEVCAEMKSPAGDPVAFRIRGAVIALRREQTDLIQVESVAANAERDSERRAS